MHPVDCAACLSRSVDSWAKSMGPNVFEFDQNKHVLEFAEHRHIIDTSFYSQCCYGHELLVPLKNCARRIWSPLRSIRPTFAPWHEMNETLQWWASPCYFCSIPPFVVVYIYIILLYIYMYNDLISSWLGVFQHFEPMKASICSTSLWGTPSFLPSKPASTYSTSTRSYCWLDIYHYIYISHQGWFCTLLLLVKPYWTPILLVKNPNISASTPHVDVAVAANRHPSTSTISQVSQVTPMLGGWRGVNALIGHHTGLHDFQGGMPSDSVLVIAVTQPAACGRGCTPGRYAMKSKNPGG